MTTTQFEDFDFARNYYALLHKKGYTRPTAIQVQTVPAAMECARYFRFCANRNGKNCGVFIARISQHLLDYPRRKPGAPRVLVLTPTRELAMQSHNKNKKTGHTHPQKSPPLPVVAYQNHGEILNDNQDIVVATPGRLLQYIKEEKF